MDVFFSIAPIILAFCYRNKGRNHVSYGDTINRITSWGIPIGIVCSAIAYAWGLPVWIGIPCAILAFGGTCIGHASEQANTPIDHIEMGFLTMAMLLAIMLPFDVYMLFIHKPPAWDYCLPFSLVVPIGFLSAFAYWVGYKIQWTFKLFGITWCTPITLGVPTTEWSEFLTGLLPFGTALSVLGFLAKYYVKSKGGI